jgi:flagellar biosynthetic protein FliR
LDQFLFIFLIMIRMTGMLMFNPILGRRNVPVRVNLGLAFFLAILLGGVVDIPQLESPNFLMFLMLVLVELAVGMISGLVIQMFLSVLIIGGDIIDMNIGIAMAKAYDPGTNASIALSTSFLNILYILIFFVTNNHHTLIYMAAQSYQVIPLGTNAVSADVLYYVPELMSSIFIFAMKLSLPVVILEVVMTMGTGIIMRVVPQINVFVVNIQMKLILGLLALFILVPAFTGFMENLITICFERMAEAWLLI